MPTLAEIRQMYPDTAKYSDHEVVTRLAEVTGMGMDGVSEYLGYKPQGNVLKDTAIDLGKGAVGLGQVVTGGLNLATGGRSGAAIRETFGGDLEDVKKHMGHGYSGKRQMQDQEVANAEGFMGNVEAYLSNPRSLLGTTVEALPSMVAPMGLAARAGRVAAGASKAEIAAAKVAGNRANTAGWAGITGTQVADRVNHEQPDNVAGMYGGAAVGALATGALTHGFSFLPGGHMAEQVGGLKGRGLALGNESIMSGTEGGIQTASENVAMGRPWDKDIAKGIVGGTVGGAALGWMGGGAPKTAGMEAQLPDFPSQLPAAPAIPDVLYGAPDGQVMDGPAADAYAQFGKGLQDQATAQVQDPAAAQLAATQAGKTAGKPYDPGFTEEQRASIYSKYGEPAPNLVDKEGRKVQVGHHFDTSTMPDKNGRVIPITSPEKIDAHIAKLVKADAEKGPGQLAAEQSLSDAVFKELGRRPRSKELEKVGKEIDLAHTSDPDQLVGHIDVALAKMEGKKNPDMFLKDALTIWRKTLDSTSGSLVEKVAVDKPEKKDVAKAPQAKQAAPQGPQAPVVPAAPAARVVPGLSQALGVAGPKPAEVAEAPQPVLEQVLQSIVPKQEVSLTDTNGKTSVLSREQWQAKVTKPNEKDRLGYLIPENGEDPLTFAQIAALESTKYGKKIGPTAIGNWAKKLGISKDVVDKANAIQMDEFSAADLDVDGENSAMRSISSPNSGVIANDDANMTGGMKKLQREADELLAKNKSKEGAREEVDPAIARQVQERAEFMMLKSMHDDLVSPLAPKAQEEYRVLRTSREQARWETLSDKDKADWIGLFRANEHEVLQGGNDRLEQMFNDFQGDLKDVRANPNPDVSSRNAEPDSSVRPADQAGSASVFTQQAGDAAGRGGEPADVGTGRSDAAEGKPATGDAVQGKDGPAPAVVAKKRRVTEAPAELPKAPVATGPKPKLVLKKAPDAAKLRAGGKGAGVTTEVAQSVVGAVTRGWTNAAETVVVATVADLPAELRAQVQSEGGTPKAAYWDGKVYLIAGNHSSPADIVTSVLHEITGHHGLRGLLGGQLESTMRQIYAGNPEIKKAADAMMKAEGLKLETAVEEVLADAAEQGAIKPSVVERIGNVLRQIMRAVGLAKFATGFTNGEVKELLRSAREFAVSGEGSVQRSKTAVMRTVAERRSATEENIRRLPAQLQKPVRGITTTIHQVGTRAAQASAFMHDLADWAAKHGMPSMKKIAKVMAERGAYKVEQDRALGKIADAYSSLPSKDQEKVQQFLYDSTFQQKWGYEPSWREDTKVDPAAEAQWKALSPEARTVADEMFRRGDEMWKEKQQAIHDLAQAHVLDQVSKAEAAGKTQEEVDTLWGEMNKLIKPMAKMDGPYVPLKRFGSHVVTVKSKELLEAEQTDRKRYNELVTDPRHYRREDYDGSGAAANRAAELEGEFGDAATIEWSEKEAHSYMGAGHEVLQRLSDAAQERLNGKEYSDEDRKFAGVLARTLNEAIIHSMGEYNSRTNSLQRKYISGVNPQEMARAFFSQGFADNQFLSSVRHNRELNDIMSTLRAEKDTGGDRTAKQNFYNEFQARQANSMKEGPAPWVGHAMRFTSLWKLVTLPAYYLQYISQPLTMFLPLVQGEHGGAKGWAALASGYKDMKRMSKGLHDTDTSVLKDPNERKMIDDLRSTGTIGIGHEQTFGRIETLPTNGVSKIWAKATNAITQLPHSLEMHNRIASALAAYRLAVNKGMKHEEATEYARSKINQGFGDYSSYNAPRIMQGGSANKLIMQYRQFQLIHTALLVRLMHNAFKGESRDVRRAARAQMTYMAGHYGVLAGGLGIPGAHLVGNAIKEVFGDEDIDEDLETFVKRHAGPASDMILGGVPRALLGQDLSSRMGAGDILSPFRGTGMVDALGSKKDYKDFTIAAMGPFVGSMVPQVIDGVDNIQKGNLYKGLEMLMPTGLGAAMKAYRYNDEGVVDRKGLTTTKAEDIGAGDILAQALGSRPVSTTEPAHDAAMVGKITVKFREKSYELKNRFAKARKAGDDVAEIVEQWKALSARMKKAGLKPAPLSDLYKAPQQINKRNQMMIDGVSYSKSNKGLVENVTGESDDEEAD